MRCRGKSMRVCQWPVADGVAFPLSMARPRMADQAKGPRHAPFASAAPTRIRPAAFCHVSLVEQWAADHLLASRTPNSCFQKAVTMRALRACDSMANLLLCPLLPAVSPPSKGLFLVHSSLAQIAASASLSPSAVGRNLPFTLGSSP